MKWIDPRENQVVDSPSEDRSTSGFSREMNAVRSILHVDMDAFFAAIEQLDDPKLRGSVRARRL